jgi:hypothetical protein
LPRKPGFFEDASRADAKNIGISDLILCVQDRFDQGFGSDASRRMPRITRTAHGSPRGTNDNRTKAYRPWSSAGSIRPGRRQGADA